MKIFENIQKRIRRRWSHLRFSLLVRKRRLELPQLETIFFLASIGFICWIYGKEIGIRPEPISREVFQKKYRELKKVPASHCQQTIVPSRIAKNSQDLKSISQLFFTEKKLPSYIEDLDFKNWNAKVCFESPRKLNPKGDWRVESEKFQGFMLYSLEFDVKASDLKRIKEIGLDRIFYGVVPDQHAIFLNSKLIYSSGHSYAKNNFPFYTTFVNAGKNEIEVTVASSIHSGSGFFNFEPFILTTSDIVSSFFYRGSQERWLDPNNPTFLKICIIFLIIVLIGFFGTESSDRTKAFSFLILGFAAWYCISMLDFNWDWSTRKRYEIVTLCFQATAISFYVLMSVSPLFLGFPTVKRVLFFSLDLNSRLFRSAVPFFFVSLVGGLTWWTSTLSGIVSIQETLGIARKLFLANFVLLFFVFIGTFYFYRYDGRETKTKLIRFDAMMLLSCVMAYALLIFVELLIRTDVEVNVKILNWISTLPSFIGPVIQKFFDLLHYKSPIISFSIIFALFIGHLFSFHRLFLRTREQMRLVPGSVERFTNRFANARDLGFSQGEIRLISKFDLRGSTQNIREMINLEEKIFYDLLAQVITLGLTPGDSPKFEGDGSFTLNEIRSSEPLKGSLRYAFLRSILTNAWLLGGGKKHFFDRFTLALKLTRVILPEFGPISSDRLKKLLARMIRSDALVVLKMGSVEEQLIGGSNKKIYDYHSEDLIRTFRLETAAKKYLKGSVMVFDEMTKDYLVRHLKDLKMDSIVQKKKVELANFPEITHLYFIPKSALDRWIQSNGVLRSYVEQFDRQSPREKVIQKIDSLSGDLIQTTQESRFKKLLSQMKRIKLLGFSEKDYALEKIVEVTEKKPEFSRKHYPILHELVSQIGYPGFNVIEYTRLIIDRARESSGYHKADELLFGDFDSRKESSLFIFYRGLRKSNRDILIQTALERLRFEKNQAVVRSILLSLSDYLEDSEIEKDSDSLGLIANEMEALLKEWSALGFWAKDPETVLLALNNLRASSQAHFPKALSRKLAEEAIRELKNTLQKTSDSALVKLSLDPILKNIERWVKIDLKEKKRKKTLSKRKAA